MESKDNLISVLSSLYRWRKAILTICTVVVLATLGISLMLDNYYQSTTNFYVASPDQFKPELIFGESEKDMEFFGDDLDLDRILTIANSNALIDFIVSRFNLYEHYDIDTSNIKAQIKVRKRFRALYEVKKTKNNAVELSVEDRDPKFAQAMAINARYYIDSVASMLIKASQYRLIETYKTGLITKEANLIGISDTLMKLRSLYGIYDLKTQSELMAKLVSEAEANLARSEARLTELAKAGNVPQDSLTYLRANISGYRKELEALTSSGSSSQLNLSKFNKGKDRVDTYSEMYTRESEDLAITKERLSQLQSVFGSPISAVHVVDDAALPIEKSRPRRSIIIIMAGLISLVFSSLGALLLDAYRDIRWKDITG
jgi:uncharacterized protein involved in exopolysaccharide biosynthesis